MPGLIRAAARTAVIAGTATGVSNRVSRRQAARWAEQDSQAYQQQYQQDLPAASGQQDRLEQLNTLGQLKASGVLTQAEFEVQKERILAS